MTDVLSVDKGEAALLTEDLERKEGFSSLEADIHNPGYAVALRDSDSGSVALIHPNSDPMEIVSCFRKLRGDGRGDFDEAVVMGEEGAKDVGLIAGYLDNRVKNVKVVNPRGSKGLGVDSEGFYYPTNPKTVDISTERSKAVSEI